MVTKFFSLGQERAQLRQAPEGSQVAPCFTALVREDMAMPALHGSLEKNQLAAALPSLLFSLYSHWGGKRLQRHWQKVILRIPLNAEADSFHSCWIWGFLPPSSLTS